MFSSSATVYGEPQFLPLTEDHPTGQKCANPYGKTKFMVEEVLKDLVTSDKVEPKRFPFGVERAKIFTLAFVRSNGVFIRYVTSIRSELILAERSAKIRPEYRTI